jgi:hypothetical protein
VRVRPRNTMAAATPMAMRIRIAMTTFFFI